MPFASWFNGCGQQQYPTSRLTLASPGRHSRLFRRQGRPVKPTTSQQPNRLLIAGDMDFESLFTGHADLNEEFYPDLNTPPEPTSQGSAPSTETLQATNLFKAVLNLLRRLERLLFALSGNGVTVKMSPSSLLVYLQRRHSQVVHLVENFAQPFLDQSQQKSSTCEAIAPVAKKFIESGYLRTDSDARLYIARFGYVSEATNSHVMLKLTSYLKTVLNETDAVQFADWVMGF